MSDDSPDPGSSNDTPPSPQPAPKKPRRGKRGKRRGKKASGNQPDGNGLSKKHLGIHRAYHRKQQDEASHDDASIDVPILDHPLVPTNQPQLLTDQGEIDAVFETLRAAGRFAYDTEFIGETTFYPRLCVLQVGTGDEVWLIDTLAEVDLTGFWALVVDPSVEKLLHAGEQDLQPAYRFTGQPPRNVFDTQVAAAFVGQPYPASLKRLVDELLHAELGSGAKFSQWDRRPLTPLQCHYAANDVRYLPLLRQTLAELVEQAGHTDKLAAELKTIEDPAGYAYDPQSQRLRGVRHSRLTRRQKVVLSRLVDWRGERAIENDVPTRSLLRDESLGDLATQAPRSLDAFKEVKGIAKTVRMAYEREIVAVIDAAMEEPLPPETTGPRFSRTKHGPVIDALWPKFGARCEEAGVAQSIAVNKSEVTSYVIDPDAESRLTRGWRAELFADLLAEWPKKD